MKGKDPHTSRIGSRVTNSPDVKSREILLLWTDQTDSSGKHTPTVVNHAATHFGVVTWKLLKSEYFKQKFRVIKNIGDSMMIRFKLERKNRGEMVRAVLDLLSLILEAQSQIAKQNYGLNIKAVVDYCKDFKEAEEAWQEIKKDATQKKLDIAAFCRAWGSNTIEMFNGDLFGRDINLSARVSSYVRHNQVLVTEGVYELVKSNLDQDSYPLTRGKRVVFSPEVTISRIRGFDEGVRKSLRQVMLLSKNRRIKLDDYEILKTLQDAKVLTLETAKLGRGNLIQQIKTLDRKYGYFSLIGQVVFDRGIDEDKPAFHTPSSAIILGGYPDLETYRTVRQKIGKLKAHDVGYSYILWEFPKLDWLRDSWIKWLDSFRKSGKVSWLMLLFLRLSPDVADDPQPTEKLVAKLTSLEGLRSTLNGKVTLIQAAQVMGESDFIAFFELARKPKPDQLRRGLTYELAKNGLKRYLADVHPARPLVVKFSKPSELQIARIKSWIYPEVKV